MSSLNGVAALVTGGAGFIGSHLVESLVDSGAIVTVLDNLRAGSVDNLRTVASQVRVIEGDVRSAEQIGNAIRDTQPQVVFHLAANASVPGSVDDPKYDFDTNARGTFVLLDELRKFDCCERVVLASTGAVYGQPEDFPIREETVLKPIAPYGASKLNAEVTARIFWDVYQVPTVIARVFNAYGPRMARFVVLDFLRKLQRNPDQLEILGDGRQVRDFTYVQDTVRGLRLLADRGLPGEAYNLSSGSSCSVTELATTLLEILGLERQSQLVYTGTSWTGDVQHWEVNIERIAALGYQSRFRLRQGLEQTVHWFQQRGRECCAPKPLSVTKAIA